ncbi:MAG: ribonuclease P protein component [Cyanobacteria bacterium]|nr:ribonuclease P protein component [Cyanobacteriota bacterium]MDA0866739.1 ribonuclease P protein component [Cyanobacteriota bacterium]
MALPKHHRLTRNRDFVAVRRFGKRVSSPSLVVGIRPRPHGGGDIPIRFGITVSQKVSKRAVIRNQLKRRVSAAVQSLLPRLKSSLDVVIVVRSPAIQCDYEQLLQQLRQLLLEHEVLDGDP